MDFYACLLYFDLTNLGVTMSRTPNDLYKAAGVNIEAGEKLASWLSESGDSANLGIGKPLAGLGNFAGLFKPDFKNFKSPVLVSSTDGVGTKILLGLEHDKVDGLGIDLVAMCVNDLYTIGALPLFFLDYFATGQLSEPQFKKVLTSIKEGLKTCKTPLLGGETAEMPGLYSLNHFDLAGFVVGVVDEESVLGAHNVQIGDKVIAICSEGFHSNGFSLIRQWLKETKPTQLLLDRLLQPTKIYSELVDIFPNAKALGLNALANITGGGISGNLCRVLPDGTAAELTRNLPTPDWMKEFIFQHAPSLFDVEHVLNLGVGMTAVVSSDTSAAFMQACRSADLQVHEIGKITNLNNPAAKALVKYV